MVIRGGGNVYPREVEEFLYNHPSVEDVQVIGVSDPRYGEELCAWMRLEPLPLTTCASTARDGSPTTRCRATCSSPTSSP